MTLRKRYKTPVQGILNLGEEMAEDPAQGLTTWFNAARYQPMVPGWYDFRRASVSDAEVERRFWSGVWWYHSQDEANARPARAIVLSEYEFRGLRQHRQGPR